MAKRIGSPVLFALSVLAAALPLRAADGAALYKTKCVMCHAADGAGSGMGKKLGVQVLTSAEVQKKSDAALADVVRRGKGKMPAFGSKLSAEEISAVVAHLRTLAKK